MSTKENIKHTRQTGRECYMAIYKKKKHNGLISEFEGIKEKRMYHYIIISKVPRNRAV